MLYPSADECIIFYSFSFIEIRILAREFDLQKAEKMLRAVS